jgi:hypothetical protein
MGLGLAFSLLLPSLRASQPRRVAEQVDVARRAEAA